MERLYFHIRTDGQFIPDEEGMIFPDMAAAVVELHASARDLWTERQAGTVEMTDHNGKILQSAVATRPAH